MAAGDGLVTMTPTSIVVAGAGSSASINADGGVDFASATSLSLNGVFTSSFDNYLIVMRSTATTGDPSLRFALRVAGVDASGTNYASQYVAASSTSVTGARATSETTMRFGGTSATQRGGIQGHIYGPFLAQPTALRVVHVDGYQSAYLFDTAGTHSLSTSYDGFTLTLTSSDITGNIVVFGYEE